MKGLKNYWKVGVTFVLALLALNLTVYLGRHALVSYVGVRLVDAQEGEIDAAELTIADFPDIPGVTQEYVDAYKLFLKAKAGDRQDPSYADVVSAFSKIAATTDNPELKLRSLFLVTFSNFLQFKFDEAYQSGRQVLALSKELYPEDSRIAKLERIVAAITKGELKNIADMKMAIADEEVGEFAEELHLVNERDSEYREMKARKVER